MTRHLKIQHRPQVKQSASQENFWTKSVDLGEDLGQSIFLKELEGKKGGTMQRL